jgi:hypothetical protein
MQHDDFVVELWSRIKPLIGPKDRLDAADAVVAVCDEYGFADGLEDHYDELDKELQIAVKTHFSIEDDYEDDEEDTGW